MRITLFTLAALATFAVSVYLTQPQYQACFQGDENMCIEVERLTEEEANTYYDGARKIINDNQRNYVDQLAEGK